MRKFVYEVASGIRRMKNPPDAFICIDGEDWCWDEEEILGKPVYHTAFVENTMTDDFVPFIPLWNVEGHYESDRANFNRGYMEEVNSQRGI